MKIEITIPLAAVPIDTHYEQLKSGEKYPVKEISMGQSNTSVELENIDDSFNSIHFEFYIGQKKVDIYRSALFNHYLIFKGNTTIVYKE